MAMNTEFFEQNSINVISWPAQSPDLNAIENLWKDVKEVVARQRPKHQNELWEGIKSAWESIPVERCQRLNQFQLKSIEHCILKPPKY